MQTNDAQQTLSPENEAFIAQQLERGTYRSKEDALNAGVDLLRERTELLNRLKEGRRQLDEGEYEELDDAGLDLLFLELNERARQRSHDVQVAS